MGVFINGGTPSHHPFAWKPPYLSPSFTRVIAAVATGTGGGGGGASCAAFNAFGCPGISRRAEVAKHVSNEATRVTRV